MTDCRDWKSEKINRPYTLQLRTYTMHLMPCPYNLISGVCNLYSVMSDVLLYAPCPLLSALLSATRNPLVYHPANAGNNIVKRGAPGKDTHDSHLV